MPEDPRTSNHIVLLALMGLVFVIMVVLGYVLYLVKDTMNIHITQRDEQEKMKEIENAGVDEIVWRSYENDKEGFALDYPSNWNTITHNRNIFSAKKLLSEKTGSLETNALAFAVNVVKIKNTKKLEIKEFLMENKVNTGKEESFIVSGNNFFRTGVVKSKSGLPKDTIYWQRVERGDIYYLEGIYYYEDNNAEDIFEEIVNSLKIYK